MIFDFLQLGQKAKRTDRHRLAGTIKVDGVPASRLVVVFSKASLAPVASTISRADTGAWELIGLPQYEERSLFVLSFDSSGEYNAKVADFISQVAAEES